MRTLAAALLALSCNPDPGERSSGDDPSPLGIPLLNDGVTYAGAAAIDLTPTDFEVWDDLDGDGKFDGCPDDPDGRVCDEPFFDANGNGWFDAVWIGGFAPLRPAMGVHDSVEVRAVVVAQDGEYLALVGMDFVGLGSPRIDAAKAALAKEGFAPDRLLAASSHNHQGPDTMGLWGDPYDFSDPLTGIREPYNAAVTEAIEDAVRVAAGAMEPVSLRVGAGHMRDRSPFFNGALFGGKNPDRIFHGMIHDGRDPIVVSDQLLVLQGNREDGSTVFTFTNWSGHPEVWGSGNNELSADWVGVTQDILDAAYGGITVHMPESLGGMQSALSGDLPLVEEDGTHVFEECSEAAVQDPDAVDCYGRSPGSARVDADGDAVPVWAERSSWEFVRSHGWHIAEAAMDFLEEGEDIKAAPLRVEAAPVYVPVENVAYQLLGPSGIFDLDFEDAVYDPDLCPEAAAGLELGCIETRTSRAQLGPVGFVAVPGELLPELAWGFPDDADWEREAAEPTARGAEDSQYFVQHPRACDSVAWSDCKNSTRDVDGCDCTRMHALPYTLTVEGSHPPLLSLLDEPDVRYRAVLGMTSDYLSYLVPEPDFNRGVSLLTDDGDHYEDTVSPAHNFATRILEAQLALDAAW